MATTEFQRAYSQLVLAVWDEPGLEKQIESNPALLSKYGFTKVPSKVSIESAEGSASFTGYAEQQAAFDAGKDVTIYIPPKPVEGATATDGDTYCCCCCPCCTCT